ncbi:MAG: GGDEF domain-containing protein [Sulfuricaulis sp.]|uniref:GGDEF domain-containing protein n=1 Tax=Sulfuricaulis sp. TaxID=2003553 RepID=UPI0025F79368|nr:GGDEF domain-containing protein [Sulfuricaulis sp.]MCR4347929.1 GGDEF domain-containing protein [Sulfuricaulis sp.]
MLHFIANGLVAAAIILQFLALRPVRILIALLPPGRLRFSWYVLTALIIIFIIGYGAYIPAFWGSHERLSDLVVPAVFFLVACFVLLVNILSLETARNMQRLRVFEQESITDPLTGIYNRRYLERRLTDEIARANRYGMPLSVLLIDIDHFKRVNDIYGHQVGDLVLEGMAQLIVTTLRTTDIVARYGGEEIMVIAPSTPVKIAADLAERLRKIVENASFEVPIELDCDISALGVTVSIGVACIGPHTKDMQDLIQSADKALYRAKSEGRNRVVTGNTTDV